MPPSDASIIPFQRLRVSFCIGSIAEPITAYDHHSTPGTTAAATDVDEIEPVVTSATSSSLHADVSKSSTGRSNHVPDVIVVAAPNVASSHKRGVSRHTHRWSCYLRPVDDGAESLLFYSLIQSVTFKLDRSFNEPIRVIDAPPFAVSDVAWAEHHVEILVTFVEESGLGSFVSSSSSSGAGAAGNAGSSSGSGGPTGNSTSGVTGVTGASHHAHSQLLLHHTVFLRERVAPEFCHVGLTAARMIANGEPAKCLVVPDSLTQGSGGGVGVGGSTSTAPSSNSEDQANGSANGDQGESNPFSNVIAARALREQLFTSHEGQATAASFDDKRRVSSALAMCMFSGGNAAAGGRVAVSERFDSLLVTHPRRKTVLFFQQLMRECKELEDEALAASTYASTSSPSVDRKRQQKQQLLPLSERIVLEDEHDVNRSDGSDAEDVDGNQRRRRKGPPERGRPKQLPMARPTSSQHKTIVLRDTRLGYERLRQIEQDLVLASAHFVARSAAATIRYDSNGSGTAPLHTYDDVDAHLITDDDRSIASSPIMGLLLLRVQHQVRLGFSLRYAAQERSATILSMTLETLEDERLASLEELRNIDTQIARLRGKAVQLLSRYRLRLKRMRDGGVDGSDAEATAMQKEREDDDAKLFARVVAAQRKPPQLTGAVATGDSQFVVVVDDESM